VSKRLRDLEHAQIVGGNELLISCQGDPECGGWIGIPFRPGIDGALDGKPLRPGGYVWTRDGGTTIDDLTLSPSINADGNDPSQHGCGHFFVKNGQIV
jgi:hypothetical protein